MATDNSTSANGSIMVVGGGISGLTTALEAAEVGYEVFLIEKEPYLGGRVAQLNQYFPKLCPPSCGLEINYRRIKDNRNIRTYTMAEVEKVEGGPGNYKVSIQLNPRFVNENCTACGDCVAVCPAERSNNFNFGMDKNKAHSRRLSLGCCKAAINLQALCRLEVFIKNGQGGRPSAGRPDPGFTTVVAV